MDFTNGTEKILSIKIGGFYYPIGCLNNNSFTESVSMLSTTTRDNENGWETSIPIKQKYSIRFSGLIPQGINNSIISYKEIQNIKRSRELVNWRIKLNDDDGFDYGKGYITRLGDSSRIDSFLSFTGTLQGYGEPSNQMDEVFFSYIEASDIEVTSTECFRRYIYKLTI